MKSKNGNHNNRDLDFYNYEKKYILLRASNATSGAVIGGLIFGSLVSGVIFIHPNWLIGILINTLFILYFATYSLLQKKRSNRLSACISIIVAIVYLCYIFSLSIILILNFVINNGSSGIIISPILRPIIGTIVISLILGPFYTRLIIDKKLYQKSGRANASIISISSVAGVCLGRSFSGNIYYILLSLIFFGTISLLVMSIFYYIHLYVLLLRFRE